MMAGKMSNVSPAAHTATTHTTRATLAVAALGRIRMLPGLISHIACENRAGHIDTARRANRRR